MNTAKPTTIHFKSALVQGTWLDDPVFHVDQVGTIVDIVHATPHMEVDESFDAVAIPGMPNIHSHAFQRAFAGLSEYRTGQHDSFWTWRKLMYDFLLKLSPEDVFLIARQLYIEMVLAGYTWVGEFHYVHNDIDGTPYANLTELSDAIIRAADEVGIGLCMLPVLYQRGGFDDQPLTAGQKRFELNTDQFMTLVQDISSRSNTNFKSGIALHSLRAVSIDAANEILKNISADCPVHIHVAEQTKEIDDCVAKHSRRSVEFLLDNFDVDERWCLIHSTHLNDNELAGISACGATAGLCPTTEANLGDGIFRASEFLDAGGHIAIGSDSHCSVDMREELRLLEYGQRLQSRSRAVLGTNEKSVGRNLYERTAQGGARAIGIDAGRIEIGSRADFTIVDSDHPAIAGATGDAIIDRLVFCNADDPIIGSVIGGVTKIMDDSDFQDLILESQAAFRQVSEKLLS